MSKTSFFVGGGGWQLQSVVAVIVLIVSHSDPFLFLL